jgi:transcriptional regulator with XRE-family HTH domain
MVIEIEDQVREEVNPVVDMRKKWGLKQTELAEMIGFTQTIISRYETGKREIPDYVLKLLDYLDKDLEDQQKLGKTIVELDETKKQKERAEAEAEEIKKKIEEVDQYKKKLLQRYEEIQKQKQESKDNKENQ